MKIYRTYDGRSFDINQPLSHFQSKEDLFDAISLTTGIPSDDIICMTKVGQQIADDVLEEMQEVSGRSVEETELFVFHRQFLYSDLESLVMELEEVPDLEAPLEEAEVVHPPTPRSLTSLVDWCSIIMSNMNVHNNHSMERLDQLQIIHRSTGIALTNLLSHSNSVRENAQTLEETASKELTRMRGLLNGHETDLKILSLVHINPKLLSIPESAKSKPKERTLGDYVSPSKMGAVYQACSNVQNDLEENLRSLKYSGSQLNDDTEGLRNEVEITNIRPSQDTLEESKQAIDRAQEVHAFILNNCLPDDQGWSAAARLVNDEIMMKRVDEAVGELILLDEVIRESLRRLTADKNEMLSRCLHLLGDVSSLQSDYADLGIELNQLDSEFKSNRIDGFRHLARLKNMLWAYGCTLIEIHRRKEFENKFLFRSQALAEVMASLSESERRRRTDFRSQVLGALPWDVRGMDDSTPSLEISAGSGRGSEEIDIDKGDVEELFKTMDFVESKLLEHSPTTPINEVKTALRHLIAQLDEAEEEFIKLVEVGLLGKPEEDSDTDEDSPDRFSRKTKDQRSERERLEKEVQDLRMHQGEKERAMAEAHDQEISSLRAELSKVKAENRQLEHTLEHERGQHEDTRKLLESRIADAEVEAARRINMEEELSRLRRDFEDARRAEMDSKVEANEEIERANDLEAHLHDLQVELDEAKDARNDACNRIEALLNKDSSAEKQLSLAQERIDDLSNQLSSARVEERKARDAQYEIEMARDKVLRNYRAEADGDRAILEENLRSQNVELQEAKEKLRRKEKEVGEHSETVKNLQGQLTAADEAHEELVRQLESNREASMDAEMAKRQADRSLEAMVEKVKPLLTKLIELHNALRDMPPLYSSSKNGTKQIKEVTTEEVIDPEAELQKQRAIEAFQVVSDASVVESSLELINCLSKVSMLDKVISKLEILPPLCKRYGKAYKHFKDQSMKLEALLRDRITFRNFNINDLALFLPTRNNSGKPWAAFNINFPHYFLNFSGTKENEQLKESLQNKEWIVARITKIESRVASGNKVGEAEIEGNPFQLAEGVKFYLLDVDGWNNANSNVAASLTRRKSTSATLKSVGSTTGTSSNIVSVPPLKRWDTSPILKEREASTGDDVDEELDVASPGVTPERPRVTSDKAAAATQVLSTSSPVTGTGTKDHQQAMTISRASSPSGLALSLRNRSTSPEVQRYSRNSANDNAEAAFTPWPMTSNRDKQPSSSAANGSTARAFTSSKSELSSDASRRGNGMDNPTPAFGRRKKLGLGLSSASGGFGTAMMQSRSAGGPFSPPSAQVKENQQRLPVNAVAAAAAAAGKSSSAINNLESAPNPFSASPATGSGLPEMPDYFGDGVGGDRRRTSSRLRPVDGEESSGIGNNGKGKEVIALAKDLEGNVRLRRESSSSTISTFKGLPSLASPGVRAMPTLSPSIEIAKGHNSFGHQVVNDERALSSTSQGSETSSSANRSGLSINRTMPRNTSTRRLPSSSSTSSWTGNWTLGRKTGSKAADQSKGDAKSAKDEEGHFSASSASQSLRRLADDKSL